MRVDSGHQTLTRRLFVARRSVDLAGKVQAFKPLGLQCVVQLSGREVIVFNGIAWPEDAGIFKARNELQGVQLSFFWKACREAVDIGFNRVAAFGLYENLVAVLVRKALHLVFYAGAIPRPSARDGA